MSDGGKGSSQRPLAVDQKTFDDNFDRIFGKGKRDKKDIEEGFHKNKDGSLFLDEEGKPVPLTICICYAREPNECICGAWALARSIKRLPAPEATRCSTLLCAARTRCGSSLRP